MSRWSESAYDGDLGFLEPLGKRLARRVSRLWTVPWRSVSRSEVGTAQPWFDNVTSSSEGWITAENRDELLKRAKWFEDQLSSWHPARNPAWCMSASAAARISLLSEEEIGYMLSLKGDPGSIQSRVRFHRVPAIVERGDGFWRALGAWPWAAVESGQVPERWWLHEDAAIHLRHAVERWSAAATRARLQ